VIAKGPCFYLDHSEAPFHMRRRRMIRRPGAQHNSTNGFGVANFSDDDSRWRAVVARDRTADDAFVYGVLTTGVFCRASCPSRRPRRENVRFYASAVLAENAGFRACLRCRPNGPSPAQTIDRILEKAREFLETKNGPFDSAALSKAVGLSRFHLHRLFTAKFGMTPKRYLEAIKTSKKG
jgi:AraC family transcriptional regulator of adaptative response/methylated-DNA-[protein]-cysteine methyltransferase